MTDFYVNVTKTFGDGARVCTMVIDERYSTVPSTYTPNGYQICIKNGNFFLCIKCALKCVTNMVLYNICDRIFDPRLIGTDSQRMEQIRNSYIVQICTDHIYDSLMVRIFVPKPREGSRGTNITFSVRTKE